MPFTPSHVLAVLPLATGRRTGQVLVPSALVVGSMVPDLPYFVPPHVGAELTHAAYGPVTLDLAAGLLLVLVWNALTSPVADLAPIAVQTRLEPPRRFTGRRWLWAAVSVVIGATTHVVWDTFTHPDRWGTRHIGWLTDQHGPLLGYKWMQYGSGVVGLVVVAGWVVRWFVATPARTDVRTVAGPRTRCAAWLVVLAVGVATVLATWVPGALRARRLVDERVAVTIATRTIGGVGAAVLVVGVLWWLGPGRSARTMQRRARSGGE